MKFVPISNLGISTSLKALKRGTQPYTMLLYQHEGELYADANRIGNHDPKAAAQRLEAFTQKAVASQADLALTPEYCCPWRVIEHIIKDENCQPAAGRLWIYGCESITREELTRFKQTYSGSEVYVHFDQEVLKDNKHYLDPLVYIFQGTKDDMSKLIVLIQFKTVHMGVWSDTIERDNLIQGEEIYILRNNDLSVNFFSLICSEAMNFRQAMTGVVMQHTRWYDDPYLVFNPQLNPDPIHQQFSDFKKFLLETGKKELITLNWTNGSSYERKLLMKYNSSWSGLFVKSGEVDLSQGRIKHNHKNGMYYFSWNHNKHAYILNSEIHTFLIYNTPVDIIGGVPPQQRRDGPRVAEIYHIDAAGNLTAVAGGIPDGHINYLREAGCSCGFLINPDNCIIEKEILVSLTTGKATAKNGSKWYGFTQLHAFNSDEQTEPNRRITFTEDTRQTSIDERTTYIDTIRELEQIFKDPRLFPDSIRDLAGQDLQIGFSGGAAHNYYRCNVITAAGEDKAATVCFMGSVRESEADKRFAQLQALFDKGTKNQGRVVVFYRHGHDIKYKADPHAAQITGTYTYGSDSIAK